QSENVTVLQVDAGYNRALPGRGAALGVQGSYYDASRVDPLDVPAVVEPRTFSTVAVEGLVTVGGPGGHRLTGAAGLRRFAYDPQPDLGWSGDHYRLLYQSTLWRGDPGADPGAAAIDLVAGYRLERRGYRGRAYTATCPD